MNVVAFFYSTNELPDIFAILDCSIAFRNILQCNLMTNWHIIICNQLKGRVVVRNDAQHFCSGFQVLDDDDADIVFLVVDQ
jgi:hypothetical protein